MKAIASFIPPLCLLVVLLLPAQVRAADYDRNQNLLKSGQLLSNSAITNAPSQRNRPYTSLNTQIPKISSTLDYGRSLSRMSASAIPNMPTYSIPKIQTSSFRPTNLNITPALKADPIPKYQFNSKVPGFSAAQIRQHDERWSSGQYIHDDPYYRQFDAPMPDLTPQNYLKVFGATTGGIATEWANLGLNVLPGTGKALLPWSVAYPHFQKWSQNRLNGAGAPEIAAGLKSASEDYRRFIIQPVKSFNSVNSAMQNPKGWAKGQVTGPMKSWATDQILKPLRPSDMAATTRMPQQSLFSIPKSPTLMPQSYPQYPNLQKITIPSLSPIDPMRNMSRQTNTYNQNKTYSPPPRINVPSFSSSNRH